MLARHSTILVECFLYNRDMTTKRYLALALVVALLLLGGYYLHTHHNPFTYYDDKVHVHADFLIMVNDTRIDLTDTKYHSSVSQILHKNVHLHDGEDNVVHRHADGITFAEFLDSLGFTLTDTCLTNDTKQAWCANETTILALYVNGEKVPSITTYISQEEDQILLYYGIDDSQKITEYINSITDEACIFSGTCPERGTAPAESCGLTCEI
jgi:hypothetical protein